MMVATSRRQAHATAAGVIGLLAVLYRFPPELYHFYPQCPLVRYLHIYCPGCGATRALAALLHGRLIDAVHYNALVVFLLPPVLYLLAKEYVHVLRREAFVWPEISPAAIKGLLLAGFLFAVLRNALLTAL